MPSSAQQQLDATCCNLQLPAATCSDLQRPAATCIQAQRDGLRVRRGVASCARRESTRLSCDSIATALRQHCRKVASKSAGAPTRPLVCDHHVRYACASTRQHTYVSMYAALERAYARTEIVNATSWRKRGEGGVTRQEVVWKRRAMREIVIACWYSWIHWWSHTDDDLNWDMAGLHVCTNSAQQCRPPASPQAGPGMTRPTSIPLVCKTYVFVCDS